MSIKREAPTHSVTHERSQELLSPARLLLGSGLNQLHTHSVSLPATSRCGRRGVRGRSFGKSDGTTSFARACPRDSQLGAHQVLERGIHVCTRAAPLPLPLPLPLFCWVGRRGRRGIGGVSLHRLERLGSVTETEPGAGLVLKCSSVWEVLVVSWRPNERDSCRGSLVIATLKSEVTAIANTSIKNPVLRKTSLCQRKKPEIEPN